MKTTPLFLAAAAWFILTACNSTTHTRSSSSTGNAARPMTYGQATEAPEERYGGRLQGIHPGAANYDPGTVRGLR